MSFRRVLLVAVLLASAVVHSASGDAPVSEQAELGMVTIRTLKTTQLSPPEEQARFKSGLNIVQGAAEHGSTRAMIFLASLYAEGWQGWNGQLLEKDVGQASVWARKALAAADLDTINQYPPVRQKMEAILNADADRVKLLDAERAHQAEARQREAERAKADAAWRADAPRREAAARQAEQDRRNRLSAWRAKPLSQRRAQCEAKCQGAKSACEFGNTAPNAYQTGSILSGDVAGALFHGAMKKDCDAAVRQCQETCLEAGV